MRSLRFKSKFSQIFKLKIYPIDDNNNDGMVEGALLPKQTLRPLPEANQEVRTCDSARG